MGINTRRHRSFVLREDYNVLVIILSRKFACQQDAQVSLRESNLSAPPRIDEGVEMGLQID